MQLTNAFRLKMTSENDSSSFFRLGLPLAATSLMLLFSLQGSYAVGDDHCTTGFPPGVREALKVIENRDSVKFEKLLNAHPGIEKAIFCDNFTLLDMATVGGDGPNSTKHLANPKLITIIELLLKKGADVKRPIQGTGLAPIINASLGLDESKTKADKQNRARLLTDLIKAGADPNTYSQYGWTPFLLATGGLLIDAPNPRAPGDYPEIIALLDAGANVNLRVTQKCPKDCECPPVLFHSRISGRTDFFELALKHGYDLKQTDCQHFTLEMDLVDRIARWKKEGKDTKDVERTLKLVHSFANQKK